MDTSKKRILMCQEAEEIQSDWKPKIGRYFNSSMGGICIYTHPFGRSCWNFEVISENNIEGREIWLPTQEELQYIYIGRNEDTLDRMLLLLESFTDKTYIDHWKPWHFFDSMEQLWLGFVMLEKYQKVWNGKDWVKGG